DRMRVARRAPGPRLQQIMASDSRHISRAWALSVSSASRKADPDWPCRVAALFPPVARYTQTTSETNARARESRGMLRAVNKATPSRKETVAVPSDSKVLGKDCEVDQK